MTKFLLITIEYPPDVGGVARYYQNLVRHWPRRGEMSVLHRGLLWRWVWPKWLPALWRVPRRVKKENIKMLLVGQVLPLGYIAWLLKKIKKTPYAVFTHGLDILLPQASKWKNYWLLKILNEAKLVVSNSEFTKNELKKLGLPERKMEVIYPSADKALFAPLAPEKRNSTPAFPYILSVGRLVKRKGFDRVIEVLPRVLRPEPQAKYVIVGQGPEKQYLLAKAKEAGVASQVIFLDGTADDQLIRLYQQCAVFALPCRQIGPDVEGLGTVLLEAAACGRPIIAGRSGGAPEAIKHGYSGFLVDPDSADELAQALIKLTTDSEFGDRLGAYGREMIAQFSANGQAEKLWRRLA